MTMTEGEFMGTQPHDFGADGRSDGGSTPYADMHCDSITACLAEGSDFSRFDGHVSLQKLKKSGCKAQCFALFTEGENAARDFGRALAFYEGVLARHGRDLLPVFCFSDFAKAEKEGKTAAVLTVENLGFLDGWGGNIPDLKAHGVQMASLVWNTPNRYAYPNLVWRGSSPDFAARERRGLTEAGREAVALLNRHKIIVDVSHLSDGGLEDVLQTSTSPIVASHSDCFSLCPVSRNLTDRQIAKIADKGGAVGVNFCADFVGGAGKCAKDPAEFIGAVVAHILHVTDAGGIDCAALGSDFDGIPTLPHFRDCTSVPLLLRALEKKLPAAAVEKVAYGNFLRVFGEVVG